MLHWKHLIKHKKYNVANEKFSVLYKTNKEKDSIQCCVAIDLKLQLSIGFKQQRNKTVADRLGE